MCKESKEAVLNSFKRETWETAVYLQDPTVNYTHGILGILQNATQTAGGFRM